MVSWWHSFNLCWKKVMDEYGFVTVDLMKSAQTNFGLNIKDRDFEKDLLDWFYCMDLKRTPGMFLIAIKENQEGGGGSISVLHHVTVLLKESGASPDIVGLDSFDAAIIFKGVKSADLFGNLTPHKGAKKVGAADYFIPSIDGLTDSSHPMKGKFVPGAKDVSNTIQLLESKINGVFIPYPLAQLLLGQEVDIEDSNDKEPEPEKFNKKNPMDLLTRLVRVMSYKKKHQPEWYRDWKAIAQEVVGLLWSVGNGFAPGIEITPAQMNRQLIEHQMECSLELFQSDKALYRDDIVEVKESKERQSLAGSTGRKIDDEPGLDRIARREQLPEPAPTRASPFTKNSPSRPHVGSGKASALPPLALQLGST
jgi:hypothetical protein